MLNAALWSWQKIIDRCFCWTTFDTCMMLSVDNNWKRSVKGKKSFLISDFKEKCHGFLGAVSFKKIKLPSTYRHDLTFTISKILHHIMMPKKLVFCFLWLLFFLFHIHKKILLKDFKKSTVESSFFLSWDSSTTFPCVLFNPIYPRFNVKGKIFLYVYNTEANKVQQLQMLNPFFSLSSTRKSLMWMKRGKILRKFP